jgi:chromosome segregation ATPase
LRAEVAALAAKDAEIARLTDCLQKANKQAEHFEREWYLRGDALEKTEQEAAELRAEVDRLHDAIEAADSMAASYGRGELEGWEVGLYVRMRAALEGKP